MAAISDFNNLVTAIQQWCARSDTIFSAQIPTFVALAEDRMNNGQGGPGDAIQCDALNAPELEAVAAVQMTNGVGAMPSAASTVRTITRTGDMVGLGYMSPQQLFTIQQQPPIAGTPSYYTVSQGQITVDALAYQGTLNVAYFSKVIPLGPTNLTNVVITNYPLLYLSGCLFEAFSFMQEPELAAGHFARYRSQVAGFNRSANTVRFGGTPLRVRPRNPMP